MRHIIKRHSHHFEFMVMLVIFIVFFALGMFLLTGNTFNTDVRTQANTNDYMTQNPAMMLQIPDGKMEYMVGDEVTLLVNGDSKGADVNGFDVLLGYDSENIEMLEVQPANRNFQAFTFPNDGYVSVTVTKLLEVQEPSVYHGNEMMSFKVRPSRPGVYTFTLADQKGNEKTKMVDSSANVLMPSLNSVEITVR